MLAYLPEMENMFMKHLVYAFLGILALGVTPAMATSSNTSGITGGKVGNVPLTQMPTKGYPTPTEILKIEEEKNRQAAEKGIPNPFEPQVVKTPEQKRKEANVKQVYRGTPDVELKRQIQDPRIDDGYVQGLIRQRAP